MDTEIVQQIYEAYLRTHLVSTDSRNLPAGCVFFCLKGPNFNANLFAQEALTSGASLVVMDDKALYEAAGSKEQLVLVEDALTALQQVARKHIDALQIPVIGIGGSNGKTTTKELIYAVLSQHLRTAATKGNLNNHIGVPLTILSIPQGSEIAVIELGTNQPGDIELLCKIANPGYGIITNIGKEHLEGFGSLEGVAKEESELFLHLQKGNGEAFVNAEDALLMQMASRLQHTITYGREENVFAHGRLMEMQPFVQLTIDDFQEAIHSHLTGEYNFQNIMAAVAIGKYFGVPYEKIKAGIEGYKPSNNRSQVVQKGGNTFLLDCYNANPSSMEVALKNFAAMKAPHKWVIIGDMFELGTHSVAEHESIARLVGSLAFDKVFCVGPEFGKNASLMGASAFNSAAELATYFENHPPQDAFIFLKASRGIALERSVASLI